MSPESFVRSSPPCHCLSGLNGFAGVSALLVVHDSDRWSCFRFIKIPLRPEGTEDWTEDQLQALVTRDAVIGVRHAKTVEEFKKEGGKFNPKSEG